MILYQSLEKINHETLQKAFLEAFSDYQVKIDLPFWKFEQMLQRKGFNPKMSIGAFENDRLVGFVLNGFRMWNGKETVYDIGTGIIGEYRRQGLTSDMLLHIKKLLKGKRVEQYLLEVLKENQAAIQLYQKQGFTVEREFSCFQLDKAEFMSTTTCKVEKTAQLDLDQLKEFWDFKPSWQNLIESICAIPEAFSYLVARVDETIAGYGVIDKRTGDIPQIAVNRDYRGRGIAGSILTKLLENTASENISVINVEAESKSVEKFLKKAGFEFEVGQYEMLLKL
ncbi:GNAT family N-acetyltransferase [Aminipila sp.]|uniref:GNAT family N-acetyltransferase n=1 Tax=Aminipila sp. TaxID=2060095 RepID=UPI002896A665|nr:GNAT family N-acetyltransferase [Aminipila sp.]